MGLVAKLLSFTRVIRNDRNDAKVSEVKIDTGGGANLTVEHFSAPGDDSHPLPDDYVVIIGTKRTGGGAAVGYADPINAGVAAAGEKRLYARDAGGVIKAVFWLKNTGEISVTNDQGSIVMGTNGTVTINGVTIDKDGNISTTGNIDVTDVTATGDIVGGTVGDGTIDLGTHVHTGVTTGAGTSGGPTQPAPPP